MLHITIKPDISARLTPQIPTIICHHMIENIKQKKGRNKHRGTRPKPMLKKQETQKTKQSETWGV